MQSCIMYNRVNSAAGELTMKCEVAFNERLQTVRFLVTVSPQYMNFVPKFLRLSFAVIGCELVYTW